MSAQKDLVRGFYEAIGAGTAIDEVMDRYVAEDFVEHEPAPPGIEGTDREIGRQLFEMMRAAFPDFRVEVHDVIEEGDKVAARADFVGTHQGELMGIPPSGNLVRMPVFDLLQIRGDKVIAHWGVSDMSPLMAHMM